jgi:molybdopterin synthase catalytic subunit
MPEDVRLLSAPFDPGSELTAFTAAHPGAGGVVSFTGIVRDADAGGLEHMEIEHYPGMTEAALADIRQRATARWPLSGALIVHRHGVLRPGEIIMMVATAARHRADAFAAAEYLMDYLKSRAPFWKKEVTRDGDGWVAARAVDEDALKRWD